MTADVAGARRKLTVSRLIRASPERLFAAWGDAAELAHWWGPQGVVCEGAEVDLRVGGDYRIANRVPDGRLVWITGTFAIVEPPNRIVFSWVVDGGSAERVEVTFVPRRDLTEVTVTHEQIGSEDLRRGHEAGWEGCLDGLAAHVTRQ